MKTLTSFVRFNERSEFIKASNRPFVLNLLMPFEYINR